LALGDEELVTRLSAMGGGGRYHRALWEVASCAGVSLGRDVL
jgi:hypothetical protein